MISVNGIDENGQVTLLEEIPYHKTLKAGDYLISCRFLCLVEKKGSIDTAFFDEL